MLCCTGYLALGACVDGDGMIGARPNYLPTAIRDIHAKCNELLICLLLRGTPLKELYQVLPNVGHSEPFPSKLNKEKHAIFIE